MNDTRWSVRSLCVMSAVLAGLAAAACGGGYEEIPTAPSVNANVPYSQTDLRTGTGADATNGKTLSVNYTGWFFDASKTDQKGAQFDTSSGRGAYSFVLGLRQVIAGWDQGVAGMKVGGQRRLVIPPALAYGATGSGSIPPNSTLVFEVELLSVQ